MSIISNTLSTSEYFIRHFYIISQLVDISYEFIRKFTFYGEFWLNRSCWWIRSIWYTFPLFTKLMFFAGSFLLATATDCFIFVIGYLMASIGCFYASTKMISTKTMPVLAVVHVFCLTFIVCLTFLISFEFILKRSKFRSRRLDSFLNLSIFYTFYGYFIALITLPLQFGSMVSAQWQGAVLFKTKSEHLYSVPSMQVLVWFCLPGPHVASSPIPIQFPTFSQGPSWAFPAILDIIRMTMSYTWRLLINIYNFEKFFIPSMECVINLPIFVIKGVWKMIWIIDM